MQKNCQNCKKDFVVEDDDKLYYQKINVPAPTFCPECRLIRRLAMTNTWNLFWRNCDKCQKRTLSVYPSTKELTIFCQTCWWADDWDGTEYAMDYDPSRPFLEQLMELNNKTPFAALESQYSSLTNCEYTNAIAWSKECYLSFWADFCETTYYSSFLNTFKNSADCLRGFFSDLCYECVGVGRCYRTFFSDECIDCVNVWFSRDCRNCNNCVGCVNLRSSNYCIFNEQYSKEDFEIRIKEMRLDTWKGIQECEAKAKELWKSLPYREYKGGSHNLNITGDYVFDCKNSKDLYIANGMENSRWCQFVTVAPAKECYDYSGWGNNATRVYESIVVGQNSDNVKFSSECWPDSLDIDYSHWCISGKSNFGCVNLKRKSYCILNKQYTKEEYEKLQGKIIEDMKKNPYISKKGQTYSYGEFFPPEFTHFPYNKSNAMRFFPKSKDEAIKMGYEWDETENPTVACTMKAKDLPDTILSAGEEILLEIIECENCLRAYKIVKGELGLLKKMGLPLPHECPKCRENYRFSRFDPIVLYDRNCAKCNSKIRTPFSKDRLEIVYCVSCYQKEFI